MSSYQLDIDQIIKKINEIDARKVGLQFPEGLKTHAITVARQIEEETGVNVIISGDPCFGACDVSDNMDVDLLVHFGHTPLPLEYEVPVMFVEGKFQLDVIPSVKMALDYLKDYKRIGLVTTAQHLYLIPEITDFLMEKGKEVIMKEGIGTEEAQVLGCNFSAIEDLSVDVFLFIGSGNFHPLGINLSTHKPVIIADPYHNEARNIDKVTDRIIRIRFAKITKAREAEKFGIIVSSKKGQNRMELAQKLKDIINHAGKEAFIIFLNQVTPELLIPYMELDAYVITACPRIAIDDANIYKKPLLTPEELLISMDKKKWDDYQMDEIRYENKIV
ncbi:MAG: diphthamide biosynthesis enzyme Dph2 [Methanothermobacter sp.]